MNINTLLVGNKSYNVRWTRGNDHTSITSKRAAIRIAHNMGKLTRKHYLALSTLLTLQETYEALDSNHFSKPRDAVYIMPTLELVAIEGRNKAYKTLRSFGIDTTGSTFAIPESTFEYIRKVSK